MARWHGLACFGVFTRPHICQSLTVFFLTPRSSQYSGFSATRCTDGNLNNYCHTKGGSGQTDAWLSVELLGDFVEGLVVPKQVRAVTIWNRNQDMERLGHYQIWVGSAMGQYRCEGGSCPQLCRDAMAPSTRGPFVSDCGGMVGTHVTVLLPGANRMLNLAELIVDAAPPSPTPPPAPPSPPPSSPDVSAALSLRGKAVKLTFRQLTPANLPHGSSLQSAILKVSPHSGARGRVVAAIRVALDCGGGLIGGSVSDYIEWDVQSYEFGFQTDETPNLTPLLVHAMQTRDASELHSCGVVITLEQTSGEGQRHFWRADDDVASRRPQLELIYDAPTTAAQLGWVSDRECNVTVAVAVPPMSNGTCGGDATANAVADRPLQSAHECAHLQLTATAATTLDSCALTVNGVDLFAGCRLNQIVVGRDGVCVAQLNGASQSLRAAQSNAPRAACFDTRAGPSGAAELAEWIEALAPGAIAMVVSCSRFAWGHELARLATAFGALGALNPPENLDDMYALVGAKGGAVPFSEARTACCENPDPVCATCDQTPAVASMVTACGVPVEPSSASVLGASYFGHFGSESHVGLVSALTAPVVPLTAQPSAATDGIATFQEADGDVFDAACDVLSSGDPYGAGLATDGDASTYWMMSGVPDAALTVDLGSIRRITHLTFDWYSPAPSAVIVLYSTLSAGDDWLVGGGAYDPPPPPPPPPASPSMEPVAPPAPQLLPPSPPPSLPPQNYLSLGSYYCNSDFPGDAAFTSTRDTSFAGATAAECQEECNARISCKGYTFEDSRAWCLLCVSSDVTWSPHWKWDGYTISLLPGQPPSQPPPSPPTVPPPTPPSAPPRAPGAIVLSDGGANAAVGVLVRRLRVHMAGAANGTFALRELHVASCANTELAVTVSGSRLAYQLDRTPTVTSIAPQRGSTAGGTWITLQVEGLPSGLGVADVSVTVVGLPCTVTNVSAYEVSCLTASYGTTSRDNPGDGVVLLTLHASGAAAATANATYEYIDLWSRYTTWGGERGWQAEKRSSLGATYPNLISAASCLERCGRRALGWPASRQSARGAPFSCWQRAA